MKLPPEDRCDMISGERTTGGLFNRGKVHIGEFFMGWKCVLWKNHISANGTFAKKASFAPDIIAQRRGLGKSDQTRSRICFTVFACQIPLFLVGTRRRFSSLAIWRSENPPTRYCRIVLMMFCSSLFFTRW